MGAVGPDRAPSRRPSNAPLARRHSPRHPLRAPGPPDQADRPVRPGADDAFAEIPALADLEEGLRYDAACSASPAGSGSGKDDPPPDEGGESSSARRPRDGS